MASGWVRCWAADAMCSTALLRRLPWKSSRCLTESLLPSPDDSATATAAPAGELRFAVESGRVADLAQQRSGRDRADAWFVAQCGAVGVEQFVDAPLQAGAGITIRAKGEGRRALATLRALRATTGRWCSTGPAPTAPRS